MNVPAVDAALSRFFPDDDHLITPDEAAHALGIEVDSARQLSEAGGFGETSERLTRSDVEAMLNRRHSEARS